MGSLSADIIFANQKDTANRFIKDVLQYSTTYFITGDTKRFLPKKIK